jgi:mono/diheme cytochrome c family protein
VADPYRLVTSRNGFPLTSDIEAVIRNGIPGTSMSAFTDLSHETVSRLAADVRRLRVRGLADQFVEDYRRLGEPIEASVALRWAEQRAEEAAPIGQPPAPPPDPDSAVARGKRLYRESGCAQCHGRDGHGAHDVPLYNDDGSHAVARDLVREPMKGGSSWDALFARLRVGMPGTPHPASPVLDASELLALVAYCRSLADPEPVKLTNRERRERASRHALRARFGAVPASVASEGGE